MRQRNQPNYSTHTQIAFVSGVHGVHGSLKLTPMTDFPEYYLECQSFAIECDHELKDFQIESIRWHQSKWLTKFAEIESRNHAEEFKGSRIFLDDSELKPLEENEIFYHQLIGCEVITLEGQCIGQIDGIIETGANDVYIVKKDEKELLIPATQEVVRSKNIEERKIHIQPLPGLLEDN